MHLFKTAWRIHHKDENLNVSDKGREKSEFNFTGRREMGSFIIITC